ncbi:MAG: hypothetical protein NZ802_10590, partial [Candidatus Poseidoniales archaeon]|nr:hypothetical protein [Candidatus Poseidoniales archaeon]
AALGLDPESTQVYFQSSRPIVQKMAFTLGRRTNLSEFEAIYGFSGDTNLAHVQSPLVQAGDILHPMLDEFGGLRPIVVPVGVDQDPHLRLTRSLAAKSNWFNVNRRKGGGMTIGLSIQEDNAAALGMAADGKLDRQVRQSVMDKIVADLGDIGFADIMANAKHGSVQIPSATHSDRSQIRIKLLQLERSMGGLGLLQPASTYHRFAVGLTGDKMSSSLPNSTIFLTDEVSVVERKIKRAFSGGQPTVEEHRRLGGNPDIDVAYQYMMYFFEEDDNFLAEVNADYRSGKILAGEMKQLCIDRAGDWLSNHKELREQTAHLVNDFLAADAK